MLGSGGKKESSCGDGPSGQNQGGREIEKESLFYFLFRFQNPIQIQNKFEYGFQIYFSIQIKMINFSKFSKNKFYNFLNSFIFKFSFLSKPFLISFAKAI